MTTTKFDLTWSTGAAGSVELVLDVPVHDWRDERKKPKRPDLIQCYAVDGTTLYVVQADDVAKTATSRAREDVLIHRHRIGPDRTVTYLDSMRIVGAGHCQTINANHKINLPIDTARGRRKGTFTYKGWTVLRAAELKLSAGPPISVYPTTKTATRTATKTIETYTTADGYPLKIKKTGGTFQGACATGKEVYVVRGTTIDKTTRHAITVTRHAGRSVPGTLKLNALLAGSTSAEPEGCAVLRLAGWSGPLLTVGIRKGSVAKRSYGIYTVRWS